MQEIEEKNINLIKISEIIPDYSNIKIQTYIPFIIKQNIIENVLEACISIDEESGFKRINSALKRMAIEFSIVNQITNIDFSEQDPLETYDDIKQAGVIDYILKNINPAEIEFITDCINEKIEEIYKIDNSLQGVVSRGLNKLLDKIPNDKQLKSLGKSLIKDINKLDPEKYSYLTQAMGWINGEVKDGEK